MVPGVMALAAVCADVPEVERRPLDWLMLLGGVLTAGIILATSFLTVVAGQEIVFVVSLAVAALLLWRIARELDPDARRIALSVAVLVFVLRASPPLGAAFTWYTIDVLKFDEAFLGRLAGVSTVSSLTSLWLASRVMARNNQTRVLLAIILIEPVFGLLASGTVFGLHHWTQAAFGAGPRELALLDTWLNIRLSNLGTIAMLTLTAFFAPPGRAAAWFALMATIMNLGLVAGQLVTKYVGTLIVVERSDYANLPKLAIVTLLIGTVVPWIAVAVLGRRLA
jgi:hypothetical protein